MSEVVVVGVVTGSLTVIEVLLAVVLLTGALLVNNITEAIPTPKISTITAIIRILLVLLIPDVF